MALLITHNAQWKSIARFTKVDFSYAGLVVPCKQCSEKIKVFLELGKKEKEITEFESTGIQLAFYHQAKN